MSLELLKNINLENVFKFGSTYAMLQVLESDLGIKTNEKQMRLVDSLCIQLFLLYSSAYTATEDHKIAMITTIIYYVIKFYLK